MTANIKGFVCPKSRWLCWPLGFRKSETTGQCLVWGTAKSVGKWGPKWQSSGTCCYYVFGTHQFSDTQVPKSSLQNWGIIIHYLAGPFLWGPILSVWTFASPSILMKIQDCSVSFPNPGSISATFPEFYQKRKVVPDFKVFPCEQKGQSF